jgi:hypothetical protein
MAWRYSGIIYGTALSVSFRYHRVGGANPDDNLYLIPAMTYSSILVLSSTLYTLRFLLQCWKYRRYKTVASQKTKWTMRHLPKVMGVAGLVILERVVYRHASTFALGLELTILKVR